MTEKRIRERVRAHLAHTYPYGVPSGAELKVEGALSERAGGDFFDGYYAVRTGSLGRPVYSKLKANGTFFSDSGADISWEDGDWAIRSKTGIVTRECDEYYSSGISKKLARVPPTNGWDGDIDETISITHLDFNWLDLEPVKEVPPRQPPKQIQAGEEKVKEGEDTVRIDGLCLG